MSEEKKKISASLEDYLEAIYEIIEEKKNIKAIEVSRKLGVGRSSVSEAIKVLAEKKLLNYSKYDSFSLTKEGEIEAKRVIQKHNTLFDFFSIVLGLDAEEADKNACKIEHVITEKAFERFSKFVDFTKVNKNSNLSDFIKE